MNRHIGRIFVPRIALRDLPAMVGYAACGAVVAGVYGMAHDQLSYAISPEYFTCVKFGQFAFADFGWPPRMFAATIGFLATWWVGFLSGWFLARVRFPRLPKEPAVIRRQMIGAFVLLLATAILGGALGLLIGHLYVLHGDLGQWRDWDSFGVTDIADFVRVAYLHGGSYLGALIGLIASMLQIRNTTRAPQ